MSIGTRFTVTVALAASALAQTTTRLSLGVSTSPPSLGSLGVSTSHDGSFVAFQSVSSSAVPGDTNGVMDVFVVEIATGQIERVSVNSSGAQSALAANAPSISGDGRTVAYSSFSDNLVPADTNGMSDIFVRDRVLDTTERVSVSSAGGQGNQQAYWPSISGDGRFVAFQSHATNLVPGAQGQVFVHDRVTAQTTVVSLTSTGQFALNGAYHPSISGDGRMVAFQSASTDITPGDASPGNGGNGWDVFVHDRNTGVTSLVSATPSGAYPNAGAAEPAISYDGRYVAFDSGASDLVASGPSSHDVFVRDLVTQQTVRASLTGSGGTSQGISVNASISSDGRWVTFSNSYTSPGSSQVYRHDLHTGATEVVSASGCGVPGSGASAAAYSTSLEPSISGDGQRIAFASYANTLIPDDLNGLADLFLRDFALPLSGVACNFCRAGTTSNGCVPTMTGTGVPSASSGGGFVVSVTGTEGARIGIAFFSGGAGFVQPWNNSSFRCITASGRLPAQISSGTTGQCDGVHAWDWTAHIAGDPPLAAQYVAGRAVFMQGWFRDPPAQTGTNLSDALQFVMQP